jgi:hypothetical protein
MRTLLPALALLAACGTTTRFVATNPSPHPLAAKSADKVDIYTSGQPQVSYVEVGIIQSRQSSGFSVDEMPQVLSKMRTEAAKIGCDGVIVNGANNKTEGSGWSDRDGGSSSVQTLEGFWGACIVYLTPSETPGAATATR